MTVSPVSQPRSTTKHMVLVVNDILAGVVGFSSCGPSARDVARLTVDSDATFEDAMQHTEAWVLYPVRRKTSA